MRDCVGSIYGRTHVLLERLIRAGRRSGEFRNDVPVRELAAIVMANHDGSYLEWYRRSGSLNGTALVRALRTVVVAGLRRPIRINPKINPRIKIRPAARSPRRR